MNNTEQPRLATGIVVDKFGDWRDAKMGTLPLPPLGAGEVMIKCEASALNFQDLLMIEGKYQYKPHLPFCPGSDVAGTIVAIGPGVASFAVGQRVAALVQTGAFADYSIARVGRCFPIPDDIDYAKAAAASSIFATVVVALTMRAQLKAGERILITGAAGGVGIAAVQYARRAGAEVTALVSSEAKEQLARQAGADRVVRLDRMTDPKQDLRATLAGLGIDGVDVVLDTVSGDVFDGAIRCLRPGGRLVVVGFASGRIAEAKTNYLLLKGISVVGSALNSGLQQDGPLIMKLMGQVYQDVAAGALDPFITAVFPLDEFHRAAALIAERSAAGKIVLVPHRPQ
jgi:NADPH:quinone reductase